MIGCPPAEYAVGSVLAFSGDLISKIQDQAAMHAMLPAGPPLTLVAGPVSGALSNKT